MKLFALIGLSIFLVVGIAVAVPVVQAVCSADDILAVTESGARNFADDVHGLRLSLAERENARDAKLAARVARTLDRRLEDIQGEVRTIKQSLAMRQASESEVTVVVSADGEVRIVQ